MGDDAGTPVTKGKILGLLGPRLIMINELSSTIALS